MSATYRIDLRRDPHSDSLPWDAVVTRLSDDTTATICYGRLAEDALEAAREWVRDEEGPAAALNELFRPVYVDDQGRDAEAPQSVKVP